MRRQLPPKTTATGNKMMVPKNIFFEHLDIMKTKPLADGINAADVVLVLISAIRQKCSG